MESKWVFNYEGTLYMIPEYMRDGIEDYVQLGVAPGSFLQAVIVNDFKHAVMYADAENMGNLPAYMNYFYNFTPAECWGSVANMNDWRNKGGLIGIRERNKNDRRADQKSHPAVGRIRADRAV